MHDLGLRDVLNDGHHEFVDVACVEPGQTVTSQIWLLVPELQPGRLYKGMAFTVQEGPRVIGRGIVEKVLNAELLRLRSRRSRRRIR